MSKRATNALEAINDTLEASPNLRGCVLIAALQGVIAHHGRTISPATAVEYAEQVAEAFDAAEAKNELERAAEKQRWR